LDRSGLLLLDFEHFSAAVMAAIRAYVMRPVLLAAVGAGHERRGIEGVLGSPAIAASLRMLAFGKRRHAVLLRADRFKTAPAGGQALGL
jgi:hypothetical protein